MKKLLIAALALFVLSACQSIRSVVQEPVLSLHSVEIAAINLNGAQLLCKVQVENPNGFDIPFPQTNWEIFINDNSFISGTVKNNHRIKGRDKTIVEVPINLEYAGIFNSFRSLMTSTQIGYKAALGLTFNIPVLGDKVWNFEHEGTIPVPQLPQVRAPVLRMENANITRAIMNVTVNITNPNPFEIPTPKITYDYLLNRNSFIKGEVINEGSLAANSTTPVVFQLTVTYSDLFRSFSAMRNLFEVPSLLVLTCDLGMPALRSDPLRFEVSGTLPILR